ncbi:S9 family peptidase [Fluviicola taffensis]|uniref:Dipeptidyl-peptidase IV n=1 Tax=Fluviicola taffensis (strain DSM 16823 / NCIMB 13979 / RW262) TaxID=755732 RepID=F2IGT9_FLUTR|nr:S9 family peptidase [Fluviicola taffensis]AEA44720.1 Dipeptidyl-peptidase IV [Fluviicola taffensis DSM 16823]
MKIKLFLSFICIASLGFAQKLSVESIWKSGEFYAKRIDGFTALSDGQSFTKIVEEGGKSLLKKFQFKDYKGAGTTLVNLSDIQFEGKTLEFDDVNLSKSGKWLLIQSNTKSIYRHSYSTTYYAYNIEKKEIRKIHATNQQQTLGTFSPDETKLGFVAGNNLFVYDLVNNAEKQITFDGRLNSIINGTTDWVYEEEFAITQGFEWSPDSKYLAFMRFDEMHVKQFQMAMYGNLYPEEYTFKYPKAGEANSKVSFHIANVETATIKGAMLGDFEYLPRFQWSPTKNEVFVSTLNRHQSTVKYHLITNPETPTDRIFFEESSDTYLDADNVILLKDGTSMLRTSEKDGYNHIYHLTFDGKLSQVTTGNWDVMDLYGIDEKKGTVFYSSSENGAMNKTLYSIQLKGTGKKLISEATGYHDAEFAPGFNYFIQTSSSANTVPIYSLCDRNGKTLQVLEANIELQKKFDAMGLIKKEFMQVDGAAGKLNAWMIKPANFDPNKKYPVYFNVYCGPGSNMVTNNYDGADYLYHQLLAQKGYIIFCVDTRGTQFQGAQFKKSTYLQLGKLETEDLIAVAKNLQKESFVDPNRIGIMGWSYGGFMTSLALTKGADVFKMGISVAPVTNWRNYDNIYTERFMRTPQENAAGYDDNSPVNHAGKLKGKLLLIHGSADDNVHYQNTMEFITALVKANKQFDLFIYPDKNHGIYGGNTRNHLFQMMFNYTIDNL